MKIQKLNEMDVTHDKKCSKLEKHPEIIRFDRIPSLFAWWQCTKGYEWNIVSGPIRITGIMEEDLKDL